MNLSKSTVYPLILIPISGVLFLYGYIGSFNRLIADSFCSFYVAERFGLFRSIWYWRINWSGRYSAYAFDWLIDKAFGTNITLIIPIALSLWIIALIVLIYYLLKNDPFNQNNLLLPIILGPSILFLILTNAPDIQQSFLWLDGFRAYSLPLLLLTIYTVFFFIIRERYPTKTPASILITCTLLVFANGGLSETFAVFQFAFIAYWVLYLLLTDKTKKAINVTFSGLIGSLLSIILIITAPGNKIRQSSFPPPLGILDIIKVSKTGYFEFLTKIIISPEKITVFLGVILLFIWAGSIYKGSIDRHKVKIILNILGAGILSFLCFPPGVYGYGEPPPQRTMIIPLSILVTLLPLSGFILGNYFQKTKINKINLDRLAFAGALILIIVSSTINIKILYQSRTDYIEFSKKWDDTNNLILTAIANDQKIVKIPAMSSWTYLDRPNENPKHWMTKCYSDFYGIQVFAPPY